MVSICKVQVGVKYIYSFLEVLGFGLQKVNKQFGKSFSVVP